MNWGGVQPPTPTIPTLVRCQSLCGCSPQLRSEELMEMRWMQYGMSVSIQWLVVLAWFIATAKLHPARYEQLLAA